MKAGPATKRLIFPQRQREDMQCPACGSDIDEDVVFCPHCRYQFQVPEDDFIFENSPEHAPPGTAYGNSDKRFTAKELRSGVRTYAVRAVASKSLSLKAI